jgi:hypothetical protein
MMKSDEDPGGQRNGWRLHAGMSADVMAKVRSMAGTEVTGIGV